MWDNFQVWIALALFGLNVGSGALVLWYEPRTRFMITVSWFITLLAGAIFSYLWLVSIPSALVPDPVIVGTQLSVWIGLRIPAFIFSTLSIVCALKMTWQYKPLSGIARLLKLNAFGELIV